MVGVRSGSGRFPVKDHVITSLKDASRVAELDGPSLSAAITAAALLDWLEAELRNRALLRHRSSSS